MSDQENSDVPEIELDFGLARIYMSGDGETTFTEMMDEFNEQKEEMIDTVEDLKRLERELNAEFADSEGSVGSHPARDMVQ